MKIVVFNLLLFVLVAFANSLYSQSLQEFNELKKTAEIDNSKKTYSEATNNQNELQITFSALFLFYKTFVSSQDNSHCNFSPSCSEYALQSIKKFGVLKGSMNALDRLSRCNGLAPEQYEMDEHQHLLIDKP